ncbi:MAG: hypothetical protein K1Y02_10720 [Candidatus Hydrogenedentes bacterium]|nr:hypothetical protein [Candidatus Hydrogenedentota bacterium]
MDNHYILGVHITNRVKNARVIQDLFSQYGCNIKTRLGLHEVDKSFCSPNGLVILEMFGEVSLIQEMRDKLKAVEGVQVQEMIFDHPK